VINNQRKETTHTNMVQNNFSTKIIFKIFEKKKMFQKYHQRDILSTHRRVVHKSKKEVSSSKQFILCEFAASSSKRER